LYAKNGKEGIVVVARIMGRKSFFLFPGVFLALSLQGCLATRGWVTEQIAPLAERVSVVETRLSQTDAKANEALDRLDHLRLEKRFVLDLKEGANFAFNSDVLTPEARRQIDGFLSDLKETEDTIFLVAGHTDDMGSESHNYELGQRRAASVARYLITRSGVDPLRVTTVSYGENSPLVDNTTSEGRRRNRRVEVLVYKEAITSAAGKAIPQAEAGEQAGSVTAARSYER
jgi:outer membrane protein OmpA-like peptidoglycan-associated protein